jgi:ABC-type sugar transport system ATPase subunit
MLVDLDGVDKTFGAVHALSGVTLGVRPGSVHALLGANGAGKSTLLKILAGSVRPDRGEIRVEGRPVAPHSPAAARRLGIVMVHQEIALVPQQSAVQNVTCGMVPLRAGMIRQRVRRETALERLDLVGFRGRPDVPVGRLPVGQQQLVEIARALVLDAKVIAFDEPTSALSPGEADHLFGIIRGLRRDRSGIVYVSHRLDEVLELADDITILREGTVVARYSDRPVPEPSPQDLVQDMMGRRFVSTGGGRPPGRAGGDRSRAALEVVGLTREPVFRDVSFRIAPGEIVGLFGLVGAGRSDVVRAIFGLEPARGAVAVNGRPLHTRSPRAAIRAGVAYLPEDRRSQGLVMGMSIGSNVTLPFPQTRAGWFSRRAQATRAAPAMRQASLHRQATEPVRRLSGGNQQKVLVARWLMKPFDVYLFDEPTRGIDVATKAEIYGYIERLADRGAAVLLVSSEVDEITRMSDRVLVMHEGRLCAELDGPEEIHSADLLALASGLEATAVPVAAGASPVAVSTSHIEGAGRDPHR